jgi:protein disulfide-isomerase
MIDHVVPQAVRQFGGRTVTESQHAGNRDDRPAAGLSRSPLKPVMFIAAVFFAVAAVVAVSKLAGPSEKIAWRTNLGAAQHEAATSNKQVLLYFTADWCGPCQQMKRTVFSDDEVERALRFHVPVKIDVDQQPVLARKYGATSIPRMVLVDDDGEIVHEASGAMTSQQFIAWVKRGSRQPPQW